jgi:hypothetical protein
MPLVLFQFIDTDLTLVVFYRQRLLCVDCHMIKNILTIAINFIQL